MKGILRAIAVALAVAFVSSCGDGSRREPDDHNGREERPESPVLDDGSRLTDEDVEQLADATARFSGAGVTLAYGTPGVMLTEDGEAIVLRDLSENGHWARFAIKVRGIELDGKTVGKDAVMIGEENGVQWWRAIMDDKSSIYFVVSKY